MSDIEISKTVLDAGGWMVATLLMLWIGLLKFLLGKYVRVIEQSTVKLAAIDVRLARIEGKLGILPVMESR